MLALFIVAGVLETTTPGGLDEKSAAAVIIGLLLMAGVGLEALAIGLGIAGYFQKNRKVLFAVLGSIFAAVGGLATLALILLGLANQSA